MSHQHHPTGRPITDDGNTQDLTNKAAFAAATREGTRVPVQYQNVAVEAHLRTRGRWLIVLGLTAGILTFALSVIWDVGLSSEMPVTYSLPPYALALGAVSIGYMEYLSRPTRSMQAQCLQRIGDVESAVGTLVGLMDEDRQHQFYKGVAWNVRGAGDQATGTEASRPLGRVASGDVLSFRRRGDASNG